MKITGFLCLLLGLAVPAWPSAHAADTAARPISQPVPMIPPAEIDAGPQPIPEADLDLYRGGQTIVLGSQTLTAATTGNVLNGAYAAGDVTLSDNALSNFNGIGNFAINTGAQVSLQSGMNLTINIGQ